MVLLIVMVQFRQSFAHCLPTTALHLLMNFAVFLVLVSDFKSNHFFSISSLVHHDSTHKKGNCIPCMFLCVIFTSRINIVAPLRLTPCSSTSTPELLKFSLHFDSGASGVRVYGWEMRARCVSMPPVTKIEIKNKKTTTTWEWVLEKLSGKPVLYERQASIVHKNNLCLHLRYDNKPHHSAVTAVDSSAFSTSELIIFKQDNHQPI